MQYVANLIQPLLVQKLQMASLPSVQRAHRHADWRRAAGRERMPIHECSNRSACQSVRTSRAATTSWAWACRSTISALSCNWHYRKVHWPHISRTAAARMLALRPRRSFRLCSCSTSRATPASMRCCVRSTLAQFSLHLHGGASWLYNLFIGALKGKIESAITNAVDSDDLHRDRPEAQRRLCRSAHRAAVWQRARRRLCADGVARWSTATDGIVLPCLGEFYDQSDPNALDPCAGQPVPNSVYRIA
jgi:hypothetical protein